MVNLYLQGTVHLHLQGTVHLQLNLQGASTVVTAIKHDRSSNASYVHIFRDRALGSIALYSIFFGIRMLHKQKKNFTILGGKIWFWQQNQEQTSFAQLREKIWDY
jgi:hypothetical protein